MKPKRETKLKASKPLVTIGIPTFNRPEGLKRVLQCATRQTYKNIEILIADNCSAQAKKISRIIKPFKKNKSLKYTRHKKNIGPIKNFEYLFRQANGKYFILFSDDDNYNQKNYIAKYVKTMESFPNCSAAMGTVDYVDKNNIIFIRDKPPYHLNKSHFSRVENYLKYLITENLVYGMLRTKFIRKYKFEKNVYAPEQFFILYLLGKGEIIDCHGAAYKNVYSFKSADEISKIYENPPFRNHYLLWMYKIFLSFPLIQACILNLIYLNTRVPFFSWPVRKILKIPKSNEGRIVFRPLIKSN